jgi:hypothetical protein
MPDIMQKKCHGFTYGSYKRLRSREYNTWRTLVSYFFRLFYSYELRILRYCRFHVVHVSIQTGTVLHDKHHVFVYLRRSITVTPPSFSAHSSMNSTLTTLPIKLSCHSMSISDNEHKSNTNVSSMTSSEEHSGDENTSSKKRALNDDPGERKEERKAANRRSAHQSRLRKKQLIEELQKKVEKLTDELILLKENNRALSQSLEASLTENRKLRFLHQQGGRIGMAGASLGSQSSFLGGLQGGGIGGLIGYRGF